jgi:hypothetical protein
VLSAAFSRFLSVMSRAMPTVPTIAPDPSRSGDLMSRARPPSGCRR